MARMRFKSGGTTRGGRIFLFLFGLLFAGMGGAFFYFFFVQPAMRVVAARSWPAVPCVIESSSVGSHSDSDGTTYSVDIAFTYEYEGQAYRSDRYAFMKGSSSGRKGKQHVVDAHPVGSAATCYVNPDDPSEAVIERGWTNDLWFGTIPLVFLIVGVAIMLAGVLAGRRGATTLTSAGAKEVDWLPKVKHEVDGGRIVLRPQTSALGKCAFFVIFALFWNGITSVFVYKAVDSHLSGRPEWFLTFFIIPFVLVGLGVVAAVVYQFLAIFNPKFVLSLDTLESHPGEVLKLSWRIDGAVGRLRRVTIALVGEESARYQRGTDTVTDTHAFLEQTVYETAPDTTLVSATGSCDVPIPADAMHSFKSPNNGVAWKLRVRGDVPRWPDVSNDYELLVTPPEVSRG